MKYVQVFVEEGYCIYWPGNVGNVTVYFEMVIITVINRMRLTTTNHMS